MTTETASAPRSRLEAAARFAVTPHGVFTLIVVYALVHLAVRFMIPRVMGLDDAEQALFAQGWLMGYRFRQPPLFTWLAQAAFDLLGVGLIALMAVKLAVLAAGYGFLYLAARRFVGPDARAALATYSFTLIFVFAWYVHHDLTHTVLVGTLIAVSLWLFARVAQVGRRVDFLALGLALGLGMLAKYNFVILIAAGAAASLVVPEARRRVWRKELALTVLVLAAMLAPYLHWAWVNNNSFADLTARVVHAGEEGSVLLIRISALGTLVLKLAEFLLPALILVPLALPGLVRRRSSVPDPDGLRAWMGWHMLFGAGLMALGVLLFGATEFKARWFHPILMVAPFYAFARVSADELGRRRTGLFLALVAGAAILVVALRLIWPLTAPERCGSCRAYMPFPDLAQQMRDAGFARGTILVGDMHVGGNLRFLFAGSRVIDVSYPMVAWPKEPVGGACLLVWEPQHGDVPPPAFLRFLAGELGASPVTAPVKDGVATAPLIGADDRPYSLNWRLFPTGAGQCN